MKMHLIILGALPPPRGGVSTHIERLIPYLEEAGIKFVVWDFSKEPKKADFLILLRKEPLKALYGLMQPGVKVLHYPLSNISIGKTILLILMSIIGVRVTITLVASPDVTLGNSSQKLACILKLALFSSQIIATNKFFKKILVENGISENKVSNFPAFIPLKNGFPKKHTIPPEVSMFCCKHKPLILTYAHGPDFHNGEDMYGLDIIVQLAEEMRADKSQPGFVVVIPTITNESYFRTIRTNIKKKGLEPFFCFAVGHHFTFIPFLQYSDIFIRATNTDGDALTLRESLYYDVPSIASDVCPRPEGALLFRNRDTQDLHRVVREALNKSDRLNNNLNTPMTNNAELFIEVFKRAAGLKE